MQFIGLIVVLIGLYLVDSGIRNRAPIGFLKAIIEDPSDLSGTLDEFNGQWTGKFVNDPITPAGVPTDQATPRGDEATALPGQKNGRLPNSILENLPWTFGARLFRPAAQSAYSLNQAFRKEFGRNLSVTSSYRTYAQQVAVKAAKGPLAATPGSSNHGWGKALDLGGGINRFGTKEHTWMVANAPKHGWVQPPWATQGGSKPEPWHWEWVGSNSNEIDQGHDIAGARGGSF